MLIGNAGTKLYKSLEHDSHFALRYWLADRRTSFVLLNLQFTNLIITSYILFGNIITYYQQNLYFFISIISWHSDKPMNYIDFIYDNVPFFRAMGTKRWQKEHWQEELKKLSCSWPYYCRKYKSTFKLTKIYSLESQVRSKIKVGSKMRAHQGDKKTNRSNSPWNV